MLAIDKTTDAAAGAAVDLAAELVAEAQRTTTRREHRRQARLARLIDDTAGREFLLELTDRVMRPPDAARAMELFRELPVPPQLGPVDRLALTAGRRASKVVPGIVDRLVRRRVLTETRGLVMPAAEARLGAYLRRRQRDGVTVNVNLLGEAILGDDEADGRLEAVCRTLARSDVTYASVKISALCANLDVLAYDASLGRICDRLRVVYRAARRSGTFVNLDMEEYRDLHLTVDAFVRVLSEPEFAALNAGIALQAYLPDSATVLVDLCAWADRRPAWVKVRIVKGANLAMEQTEAEIAGWTQAPYATKAEVDANYKRLLDTALASRSVHIGVASHNLLDVAWALIQPDPKHQVGIEMLEGMAPAQARAVLARAGALVLYAPVVAAEDFDAAIAYLARRLDENSAPDNFLRSLFTIEPGSPAWEEQRSRFVTATHERRTVSTAPRRSQDRRLVPRPHDPEVAFAFANAPDTDFSLAANRAWIAGQLGVRIEAPPNSDVVSILRRAKGAAERWRETDLAERRRLLHAVADVMERHRGRTIGFMAAETGKVVREGDTEVSEAVDMARWCAHLTHELGDCEPRGLVVIASPWNFPYAIPANGVLSAIAAGNTAILKPAPEAVATAAELVRHIHEAGVPDDVVQLAVVPDGAEGKALITSDDVDAVILTGAYETARMFLDWKPRLHLIAETSGKNAIVVTGAADADLAIRDVVRSAFGHAGQKCSAASLVIVTHDIADRFCARLADAVRSIRVGDADDLSTMMGPLIRAPGANLQRALNDLDPGERWLVEPGSRDATHWTPGVKSIEAGSWFHRTECFGPVLGVLRARDLDEAVAMQNGTDYGLTGGIHSLDDAEIADWLARVEVGNAYVNRHITGAIVRRQPFGGWKRSSLGPGSKTGGYGDLQRLVQPAATVANSFDEWWARRFGVSTDATGLRAEENLLRYRPVRKVVLVADEADDADDADDLTLAHQAARLTRVPLEVTTGSPTLNRSVERLRLLRAPANDAILREAHELDIRVDIAPLTGDGNAELPRWLREQAISRTRHRHGRVDRS